MDSMSNQQRQQHTHNDIKTYIRMVEDLERLAANEPFDRSLVYEIKELKQKVESLTDFVYLDGHARPFRLVPER
jgi:hypothetical protein